MDSKTRIRLQLIACQLEEITKNLKPDDSEVAGILDAVDSLQEVLYPAAK